MQIWKTYRYLILTVPVIVFLFSFKTCLFLKSETPTFYTYAIVNKSFAGEKNQIAGICNQLKNICDKKNDPTPRWLRIINKDFVTKEFDIENRSEFETQLKEDLKKSKSGQNNYWIITSGDYGIEFIEQHKKIPQLMFCHSSHQLTPQHQKLINKADIIALPIHTIEAEFEKEVGKSTTKLVKTIGVAHNLTQEKIEESYAQNKNSIIIQGPYLGIILGGDAPTPEGKMLYYTQEEAEKLAEYVAQKAVKENFRILILNGPRTGKHDPKTGIEDKSVHRNSNIDKVTQKFMQTLTSKGLKNNKDFQLFDFQFGSQSMYPTVLGAIAQSTENQIIVTGESTSMISEITSLLSPKQITIFTNEAMNKNHFAHIESEFGAGRANILDLLDPEKKLKQTSLQPLEKHYSSAAAMIAYKMFHF
jgi:mitochondrial fission protein ELM1